MGFDSGPFGADLMFSVMPVIFILFFILISGIIIFSIVKGISQWRYNNSQPVLTIWAKVVAKRIDISSHTDHHAGDVGHAGHAGHHHHSTSYYYSTFEVESGDRMELQVRDTEYGVIAEGDAGKLTFQGTRYLGFQREVGS